MRIVNLETFLNQPAGTVFSKYAPCHFKALSIKGDSLLEIKDFCYQQIADAIDCTGSGDFGDKLQDAEVQGISLAMDFDCQGRDGCFEEEQLFAIFEKADLEMLISRLQEALSQYA